MKVFLLSLIFYMPSVLADPVKEYELLDFSNIKEVLKNDLLESERKKKHKTVKKIKKKKKIDNKRKYFVPQPEKFWSFVSEYWLVQNASRLKWDFARPSYGVAVHFKALLEKMGFFEQEIKILFLNILRPYHMAIPSDKDEYIFLLSVPFIKRLDLSQSEMALILLEDFLRIKARYFHENVAPAGLKNFLGSNFYKQPFKKEIIDELFKNYSSMIFERGFSFKQQFEITKQMGLLLEERKKEMNTYYKTIKKIDELVKVDKRYKDYLKVYPSPELQMGWLETSRNRKNEK